MYYPIIINYKYKQYNIKQKRLKCNLGETMSCPAMHYTDCALLGM